MSVAREQAEERCQKLKNEVDEDAFRVVRFAVLSAERSLS